jgi:hypothetical protein
MTLAKKEQHLVSVVLMYAVTLLVGVIYYSHATNHDLTIGIADKKFVFAVTSLLGTFFLMIAIMHFRKIPCDKKYQEKISEKFGCTALLTSFGSLFFFGVFWTEIPPLWLSDLLVQISMITGILSIAILPKKSDHTLSVSVLFALLAGIVYILYRF